MIQTKSVRRAALAVGLLGGATTFAPAAAEGTVPAPSDFPESGRASDRLPPIEALGPASARPTLLSDAQGQDLMETLKRQIGRAPTRAEYVEGALARLPSEGIVGIPIPAEGLTPSTDDSQLNFQDANKCSQRVCINVQGFTTYVDSWRVTIKQDDLDALVCDPTVIFELNGLVWDTSVATGCYSSDSNPYISGIDWIAHARYIPAFFDDGDKLRGRGSPLPPFYGAPSIEIKD